MKAETIDSGFLRISAADAKRLAGGKLPPHGRECLVCHEGKHYWLSLTVVNGAAVWSIRETSWRLVNGRATLP